MHVLPCNVRDASGKCQRRINCPQSCRVSFPQICDHPSLIYTLFLFGLPRHLGEGGMGPGRRPTYADTGQLDSNNRNADIGITIGKKTNLPEARFTAGIAAL